MHTRSRVRLLGGLCIEQADRIITHFRTQKTGALLAYLVYYRERSHPREQLIDRLAIEKAMLMLAPGYRSTFILHDIEGYKHGEAARLSGHTVGTSKSQLHKARAGLRAMLSMRSPALHAS